MSLTSPSPAPGPDTSAGYLDSVSGEPLHPAAREALLAALGLGYADPLRLHHQGREARLLLDNARAVTAQCLGVRADEVTFMSSGTAAVHSGVLGLLTGRRRVSTRLALSAVEHSSVFAAARWWEGSGGSPSLVVGVDAHGVLDASQVPSEDLGVLAVQQANAEIGTLQDLDALESVGPPDLPLFVDACAAGARLPLPRHWSAAALSAHKWGGPAGVGVLLVRRGARWRAPFPTDDRADHRGAGFENVPAVLAAAAALQVRVAERDELAARHTRWSGRLLDAVRRVPDVQVHGHPKRRLPHVVSFSALYVEGEALVRELDRHGFSVASGSACTASALEPSHVLVATGGITHGNARVSFLPGTTEAEVDRLAATLPQVIAGLREEVGRG